MTATPSMPRLPVPALSQTLDRYIESCAPHLSDSQLAACREAIASSKPQLEKLQDRLLARAQTERSWLADWFNMDSYMGYRDPVIPHVNYFYSHAALPPANSDPATAQSVRAALIIQACLEFNALITSGTLKPDATKTGPMCMEGFKWMFSTARVPQTGADVAVRTQSEHIVVLAHGRFYKMHVIGKDAHQLQNEFQQIIDLKVEQGPAVGVLTTQHRDDWAKHRVTLSGQNYASLLDIDTALTLVSLPAFSPEGTNDISSSLWLTDPTNTWADKHNWIVYPSGRSGFNGEHSKMDGTGTIRANEFVLGMLEKRQTTFGVATGAAGQNADKPLEIPFVLDAGIKASINKASKEFVKMKNSRSLNVVTFKGYGKGLMKSHSTSPDAWAQMIHQLAWHKLHQRPAVVYESAQTRRFDLGRTEVIRAASPQSKAWVHAMVNNKHKAADAKTLSLFREACARHLTYAGWAASGQAVDRHLYGLKKTLQSGESMPAIYKDEAFGKCSNWELSTSQLSSPLLENWGYGQVVPNGFGLSYSILEDRIIWTVTSTRADVQLFSEKLREASEEMGAFMSNCKAAGLEKTPERQSKL